MNSSPLSSSSSSSDDETLNTLSTPAAQRATSKTRALESAACAQESLLENLRSRNVALRAQLIKAQGESLVIAQLRARTTANAPLVSLVVEDWRASTLALRKQTEFNAAAHCVEQIEAERDAILTELRDYAAMSGHAEELGKIAPDAAKLAADAAASSAASASPDANSPEALRAALGLRAPALVVAITAPAAPAPRLTKLARTRRDLVAALESVAERARGALEIKRSLADVRGKLEAVARSETMRLHALDRAVVGKERAAAEAALNARREEAAAAEAEHGLSRAHAAADAAARAAEGEAGERVAMARARAAHNEIALVRAQTRAEIVADARGTRGLTTEASHRMRLAAMAARAKAARSAADTSISKLLTYETAWHKLVETTGSSTAWEIADTLRKQVAHHALLLADERETTRAADVARAHTMRLAAIIEQSQCMSAREGGETSTTGLKNARAAALQSLRERASVVGVRAETVEIVAGTQHLIDTLAALRSAAGLPRAPPVTAKTLVERIRGTRTTLEAVAARVNEYESALGKLINPNITSIASIAHAFAPSPRQLGALGLAPNTEAALLDARGSAVRSLARQRRVFDSADKTTWGPGCAAFGALSVTASPPPVLQNKAVIVTGASTAKLEPTAIAMSAGPSATPSATQSATTESLAASARARVQTFLGRHKASDDISVAQRAELKRGSRKAAAHVAATRYKTLPITVGPPCGPAWSPPRRF